MVRAHDQHRRDTRYHADGVSDLLRHDARALNESASVSGATTTTYEVTGLATGTWYFAVAAVAADGDAQSSVGSKSIP